MRTAGQSASSAGGIREEFRERRRAGARRPKAMQDGSFGSSRARKTQPSVRPSYHGAGHNYPKQERASEDESRTVYASTFVAAAVERGAKR